jgi:hypothetical protein
LYAGLAVFPAFCMQDLRPFDNHFCPVHISGLL